MNEVLDKISQMDLNINSETAYKIAHEYIQFQYFNKIFSNLCIFIAMFGIVFLVFKIEKSIFKD